MNNIVPKLSSNLSKMWNKEPYKRNPTQKAKIIPV
jgi:hypothetical protein